MSFFCIADKTQQSACCQFKTAEDKFDKRLEKMVLIM